MSISSQPYLQAALIAAVPATLTAGAAWYQAHRNGKREHKDTDKIDKSIEVLQSAVIGVNETLGRFETRFERIDTHFERLDLRLDSIEDKVERHLGWHRNEAEVHLQDLLKKETPNVRPSNND